MKVKTFALAIGAASGMLLAGTANADVEMVVTQITEFAFGQDDYDAAGLHTYRFAFAMAPGMRLDGVRGNPATPAFFYAGTLDDPQPFFNAPDFGQGLQPGSSALWAAVPALQWNSWVTIGYGTTAFSPDFPGDPDGNTPNGPWNTGDPILGHTNIGWFRPGGASGNSAAGAAWGDGADDPIVVMQLTAPADLAINATFNAQFELDGEVITKDFSFSSAPAPGALALLGLAGLAGVRRRRA